MTPTRTHRLAAAWLALLLPTAPALAADVFVNVSDLVNGVPEATPVHPGTKLACGSSCSYAAVSAAGMDNGYALAPANVTMGVWPVAFGSALPAYAAVDESLPIPLPPAGSTVVGLSNGVLQRAAVDYDTMPILGGTRKLSVQTWKSGTGVSVVSYAVRINTTHTPRLTYLSFTAPTRQRSWVHAWSLGGPSGYETVYSRPNRLQTRSAVDVYVDGLPVWSSDANMLVPLRYPANGDPLLLEWDQALPTGEVTLFLGTLPIKSVRTAVVVMRTEVRVDAPTCRTRTEFNASVQSCSAQLETLSLPSTTAGSTNFLSFKPLIAVYTR